MNKKRYIVGVLVAGFVGWLIFSPEDEAPERSDGESRSGSGGELRSLPKEPEPLSPASRHDIVGVPASPDTAYGTPYPYDYGRPPAPGYFAQPQAPDYYGQLQTPDYYGQPQTPVQHYREAGPRPDPMERFSFRPLSEREREQLRAERPASGFDGAMAAPQATPPETYSGTRRASKQYPQRPAWPPYGQTPTPPQWNDRGYSFRPLEQSPGGQDRRRGIYRDSNWDRQHARDSDVPWSDPSAPQWGSAPPGWMPPAERMYPSLHKHPDGKLTAR